MMEIGFRQPHREAALRVQRKPTITRRVFDRLAPEARARAFTITGVEDARVLSTIRKKLAAVAEGATPREALDEVREALEPYLGGEAGERRAEVLLNTHTFAAYSASTYNAAMLDGDTTHLQYVHGDTAEVPTPEHLALDGLVLPKNDPFWETHTGPWGHFGCVCYARPVNAEMVDDIRRADAELPPEEQRVVEGARLDRLRGGALERGGRTWDVSPPESPNAFRWNPRTLDIPLETLRDSFAEDPEAWKHFERYARRTEIAPGLKLWDALNKPARAKEDQGEGHWITTDSGAHVFIREGGPEKEQGEKKPAGESSGGGAARPLSRKERARLFYNPATRDKQRLAEANEYEVARALGGKNLDDNEPFDVELRGHGIEVKTIIAGKNPKITMHPESLRRKLREAKKRGLQTHTVVIDQRGGEPVYYYRRGLGSFRLQGMERCASLAELKKKLRA